MDPFELNRAAWDLRTEVHWTSRFYDVKGWLAGASSLREIELAEMGPVAGRSLLHLQCHFGLDTLSWARLGARCTGVDISPVAIGRARELSRRSGVGADFVCANVYDYDRGCAPAFDVVFASYGILCWLPDVRRWAEIVATNLAPGGVFCLVEFHPIYDLLAGYSYFTETEPDIEESGTYTENGKDAVATLAQWAHPLSSVVGALIEAGIRIESLKEYPFSPYDCFPGMVEREPGRFHLQHGGRDVPIVYSIRGRKVG